MHPNTLVDLFELKAKLHSLKSTMSDDEKNVINVVPVINDEIKDLNRRSWPPKEDDLKPDRTRDYIPFVANHMTAGAVKGENKAERFICIRYCLCCYKIPMQ